ncbi:RNA polymerase sigma factor [Halostreptopolyspora alba]|uniref:RNA polymerase sigma factor n=1 Tax=Halostreptopolyspora alba TaxID=2487137 RepID=UPI00267C7857
MATEPDVGPPTRAGAELAGRLRQGEGHDLLYNAYAAQLYRYCWTLVGADSAGDAAHEAILAAVQLIDQLDDHSDLRAWLFALARSACQRRGLRSTSPYVQLAARPDQHPVVEMARRLPPSHSELLELYLRHSLAPSQIARIQGLDPDITSELCRAAVRRAADVCAERAPANDSGTESRLRASHTTVSEFLASLEPPEPPEDLRERTLHGCADSAMATEREAAGAAMAPLGPDGFPLQRDRSGHSAEGDEPSETAVTSSSGSSDDADPLTEHASGGHASTPGPEQTEEARVNGDERHLGQRRGRRRSRRHRWPLPAVSGLVTVGVALAFWGVALTSGSAPNEPAPSTSSETPRPNSAASEETSDHLTRPGTAQQGESPDPAEPDHRGRAPDGSESQEPASGPDDGTSATPDPPATEPGASPEATEEERSGGEEATSPEEGSDAVDEANEAPESGEDSHEPRGPISELFDELFTPDP